MIYFIVFAEINQNNFCSEKLIEIERNFDDFIGTTAFLYSKKIQHELEKWGPMRKIRSYTRTNTLRQNKFYANK